MNFCSPELANKSMETVHFELALPVLLIAHVQSVGLLSAGPRAASRHLAVAIGCISQDEFVDGERLLSRRCCCAFPPSNATLRPECQLILLVFPLLARRRRRHRHLATK